VRETGARRSSGVRGVGNCLIVEFTGARGVGKSTLVELVRSELEKRGVAHDRYRPLSLGGKLLLRLASIVPFWRSTYTFIRWRPVSFSWLRKFQRRFRAIHFRSWRYQRQPGVYLLDEGVFQLMMVLNGKTAQKDMNLIASALQRIARFPDMAVLVQASEEAIAERRKKRGNQGDQLKPKLSVEGRSAYFRLRDFLHSSAASDCDAELISIDNRDEASLPEQAKRVADSIICRLNRANQA
jgi:thymidylate kinase